MNRAHPGLPPRRNASVEIGSATVSAALAGVPPASSALPQKSPFGGFAAQPMFSPRGRKPRARRPRSQFQLHRSGPGEETSIESIGWRAIRQNHAIRQRFSRAETRRTRRKTRKKGSYDSLGNAISQIRSFPRGFSTTKDTKITKRKDSPIAADSKLRALRALRGGNLIAVGRAVLSAPPSASFRPEAFDCGARRRQRVKDRPLW
jgi:hypothetical protein